MALHQFLFGSTLMIILSLSGGCDSQLACGRAVRNTRIVGGQNVSPGSWPWQATLVRDGRGFCSGSLIHHQWVMTAAHCVIRADLQSITVFLGRNSQSGPNPNEVSRRLDMIRCHNAYDSLFNNNDICLLKLSAPVTFTDYIQPVCVASASSVFHTGVSSWVAGFGLTEEGSFLRPDILQEVNVPVVGNNECRCAYSRRLTENMMCAGLRAGGKDACSGDSGAPLVTKKNDVWIQMGIVSFGDGCARPNTPGGYTRVSRYEQWITDITGSSRPGFVTYMSSGVDSDANFDCSSITDPVTGTTTTAMTSTTMTTTITTTPTTTMSTTMTTTPSTTMSTTMTTTPTTTMSTTMTTTPSTTMSTTMTTTPSTTMSTTMTTTPTTTTTMPTTTTTTPTTTTTMPTTTTTTPTTTTTMPTTTTTTPTTTTTMPTTTTTTPTTTTTMPTTTTTTPTTTTTMPTTTTTTPTTTTTMPTTTTTTPTTTTTMPTTTTTTPTPTTTTTTTSTTTTTTTPTTTTTTTPMITKEDKGTDDDSVFDSGERVIHFSHFTSLCLLIISLFVLGGDT